MIKFGFGVLVGTYVGVKNRASIVKFLEDALAKLELRRDILRHDNPDIN